MTRTRILPVTLRLIPAALSWLATIDYGVAAHAEAAPVTTEDATAAGGETTALAGPQPSEVPETEPPAERLSLHGQTTFIDQYHPAFHSPYRGPLSLDPGSRNDETFSVSLFVGGRLWRGSEFYVNPELLQGFGLSNTTGIAGFTNGEAFKVGTRGVVDKVSRLFFRQTFALGDRTEMVESAQNQLAGERPVDRVTITVGKYAVVDIFDDNKYAHDSRSGFLNWTMNDMGAFDMASPAYNYTYGAAVEWYQAWWALRAGFFLEPTHPNSVEIDLKFRHFQPLVELEERHTLLGQGGKLKLLLFAKHIEAGSFSQALASSEATGQTPDTAAVRNGLVWVYGGGLNLEQLITPDLAIFARGGVQSGKYEEFSFTQVEQSVAAGLVMDGRTWGRDDDVIGLGAAANGIFDPQRAYLAAGGTGIIIGDGALNYGTEEIVELYYKFVPWKWAAITPDYQFVNHPAYNRDRGPVSVFGARAHLEF